MFDSRREPYSHVNRDGLPKRVYEQAPEATAQAALLLAETGDHFLVYLCRERPIHFHVARVRTP